MILMNRNALLDKIYACWMGKNIGGTLGGPFEGRRELLSVEGFTTAAGEPLPNDDLDLQLVWLKAIEERGKHGVNERVLGEYWLEYISPYWNEYGICKMNLSNGLTAPLSGELRNEWKHSNGAWIRTEIWACLFPCLVDEAVKYARMDACVDHGTGEGSHAAAFVAAMESAAFAISDVHRLIEIGLSVIPADCRLYRDIVAVRDAYREEKSWQEAREIVTAAALADPELGWFQAPANVAYVVIGLLWGEGDFKRSMLTAVNCGDDTDCTASTVGALLGIMNGTAGIPDDWSAYIGDRIVTVAINKGMMWDTPTTCVALTDRILALLPSTLGDCRTVVLTDGENEICADEVAQTSGIACDRVFSEPYSFRMDFILSRVLVQYASEPQIRANGELALSLTVRNRFPSQKHFGVEFLLPEGWRVFGDRFMLSVKNYSKGDTVGYTLIAGDLVQPKNHIVIRLTCEGHSEVALIPLTVLG